MPGVAKKKNKWKEDLFFAVMFAQKKLSTPSTEATPTMCMLFISAHILDPFWKLRSYRKREKGMHINHEDETSYTTQSHEEFLHYVNDEYCTDHKCCPPLNPKVYRATISSVRNCFSIHWILFWSIWFIQWWWRIRNTQQCGWHDTQTKQSRWTLIDGSKDLIGFTPSVTNQLGAGYSECSSLLLWPNDDSQCILDTGYHRLVVMTRGKVIKACRCL